MLLTVSWLLHFPCLFASFTTNTWSWLHDLDGSPRSDIKNIYHRKCFFNLSHISYFIYKMARLSLWPFSYQVHRLLCWGICEITSQKSRHLLWRVTYRCWGLYIARGLNGLEIFLLLAKDLGVKLLTWELLGWVSRVSRGCMDCEVLGWHRATHASEMCLMYTSGKKFRHRCRLGVIVYLS